MDYGNRRCCCSPKCIGRRWRTGFECRAVWELAGWAMEKSLSVVCPESEEGTGRVVEISGWCPEGCKPKPKLEVVRKKLLELMHTVGEVVDEHFTQDLGLIAFMDTSKGREDAAEAVKRFQGDLAWDALQDEDKKKHVSGSCKLHFRVMPELEKWLYDSSDSDDELCKERR